MKSKKLAHCCSRFLGPIFVAILMLPGTISASDPHETVVHRFGSGSDGSAAYGRVISDKQGNLYGTTALGGTFGAGIVFKLTKPQGDGAEAVLYNFTGGSDGSQPYGGLIFDSAGDLYGTTYRGGTSNAGTVYRLTPADRQAGTWTQTVLYSFAGGTDGLGPQSDLNFDQAGNLYGTTDNGGEPGNGIVFQLTPPPVRGGAWTETVLHRFMLSEGTSPRAAVICDRNGSLYGTLANDGAFGAGAVFRLQPPATRGGAWTEETLYTFTGGADGLGPLCRLIMVGGNLYGTTVIGGADGVGTIFQLTPPLNHHGAWTETILHSFTCGSDGCYPWAGLIMDKKGVFYGTTQFGGLPSNGGTVFQLKLDGDTLTESVLLTFEAANNQLSASSLLLGKGGALYGTTIGSGMNAGIVFKLRP